jgi:hypothetical protein
MKFLVVAFCSVLISTPAAAQMSSRSSGGASGADLASGADAQANENESNAQSADGERRICRRVETSSASRMSTRRVCRTAQEWRDAQRAD